MDRKKAVLIGHLQVACKGLHGITLPVRCCYVEKPVIEAVLDCIGLKHWRVPKGSPPLWRAEFGVHTLQEGPPPDAKPLIGCCRYSGDYEGKHSRDGNGVEEREAKSDALKAVDEEHGL